MFALFYFRAYHFTSAIFPVITCPLFVTLTKYSPDGNSVPSNRIS